jgi:hypothetical protein
MKTIFSTFRPLLMGLALFSFSCSSGDITFTLNDPAEDEKFLLGSEIHVDADVVSTHELSEAEVHIHGKTAGSWDFEQKWNLSGKNINFHEDVAVPENASVGKYDFELKIKDVEGNQASKKIHIILE